MKQLLNANHVIDILATINVNATGYSLLTNAIEFRHTNPARVFDALIAAGAVRSDCKVYACREGEYYVELYIAPTQSHITVRINAVSASIDTDKIVRL